MEKIVLFDMDGTLTKARQTACHSLYTPLKTLARFSSIGILTGSDIEYVRQQMKFIIDHSEIRYKLHLLPCNGTKHYIPPNYNHEQHQLAYQVNMKNKMKQFGFDRLMKILIDYQNHICSHYDIPLTGHFISYRGSMINWCPIGRNASIEEREEFINFDKKFSDNSFRSIILDQLNQEFENLNMKLTIKLGGETSFDIYPHGWDKTYALNHFENHFVWFVGDRCEEGGNDKEIYDLLQPYNSFKVSNPAQTKTLLEETIIPLMIKGEQP